jgi:hypothetical protein
MRQNTGKGTVHPMSVGPDCQDEPRIILMTDLEMPRCIIDGSHSHYPFVFLVCPNDTLLK